MGRPIGQHLIIGGWARGWHENWHTKTHKPHKSQLFEIRLKPLEGFKNGKIISWLRLDTQDHVLEIRS